MTTVYCLFAKQWSGFRELIGIFRTRQGAQDKKHQEINKITFAEGMSKAYLMMLEEQRYQIEEWQINE